MRDFQTIWKQYSYKKNIEKFSYKMTITFLNQNAKPFLDIPGQFCNFPRTSQYEIQGYIQDKGSFLGLFLEKSWTLLLLLSKNKFLFDLCYCSNNHILLCIFIILTLSLLISPYILGCLMVGLARQM